MIEKTAVIFTKKKKKKLKNETKKKLPVFSFNQGFNKKKYI